TTGARLRRISMTPAPRSWAASARLGRRATEHYRWPWPAPSALGQHPTLRGRTCSSPASHGPARGRLNLACAGPGAGAVPPTPVPSITPPVADTSAPARTAPGKGVASLLPVDRVPEPGWQLAQPQGTPHLWWRPTPEQGWSARPAPAGRGLECLVTFRAGL